MCVLLVKLLKGPYWFYNFLPALNNFIPVLNNFLSVWLVTQGFLLIILHWGRCWRRSWEGHGVTPGEDEYNPLSGKPCIPGICWLFGSSCVAVTQSDVGHLVAGGAWLAPVVVHLQEPVPPPLPETTKNALPDASKINYGIKIALFKSFILCY